ncbi:uncharacterized protein LOC134725227 isoform X2 [Mytilus trossulus]|uniref:uncharacterized protein LOC134725227 isoform X2 n=1 Tax=Mytilus trossulus TaxID=6551 RepID=UPI003006AF11
MADGNLEADMMRKASVTRILQRLKIFIGILICIAITLLLLIISSILRFNWKVKMSEAPRQLSVHPLSETTVNGIPLIIHQTWKSKNVPDKWKDAQASWTNQSVIYPLKRKYNEFVYMLWTDKMLDTFIKEKYPWFYNAFHSYHFPISRTDAGRYFLLYHYGGVYSDLDIGCNNQSIRKILSSIEGHEGVGVMEVRPYGFSLEVLISAKGHPFMKSVISGLIPAQARHPIPYLTVLLSAGPLYFTAKYGLYKNKHEIHIVSPALYEGKYFKHYHGGSWHSWDGELIWWFYNHGPLFLKLIILAVIIFIVVTLKNNNTSVGKRRNSHIS